MLNRLGAAQKKAIARLWNQFCEFTSIPTFRFMTTNISFFIRSAALLIFNGSMIGLTAQTYYIVDQYFQDHVIISSTQNKLEIFPVPLVYICGILQGKVKVPFYEVCGGTQYAYINSTEVHEKLQGKHVKECMYTVSLVEYACRLRCKWTSSGFCIEVNIDKDTIPSNNVSMSKGFTKFDISGVSDLRITITFQRQPNETQTLSAIYVRSQSDPLTDSPKVPLVGAPHMIVEQDSYNVIEIVELLKIEHPDAKQSSKSYESCLWDYYSNISQTINCTDEVYANMYAEKEADYIDITYNISQCSLEKANKAMKNCISDPKFTRQEVESAISNDDVDEETKRINVITGIHETDLVVMMRDVIARDTVYSPKAEYWKLMSELGGTLSLYVGFTVMSLLEAIAFFAVPQVRKDALQDEETLMMRKNPRIKDFPTILRSLRDSVFKQFSRGSVRPENNSATTQVDAKSHQ